MARQAHHWLVPGAVRVMVARWPSAMREPLCSCLPCPLQVVHPCQLQV